MNARFPEHGKVEPLDSRPLDGTTTRPRPLCVLNVAYPFAQVGPAAVGGAEQMLTALDAALTHDGHRSLVLATEGSIVAGILLSTPSSEGVLDEGSKRVGWENHRAALARATSTFHPDVIHLHGVDFYEYLPAEGPPVLATLHLPPSWYPASVFQCTRPYTYLNCVSSHQSRACPPCDLLLPVVENGVETEFDAGPHAKRPFVMCLGRICPEKGYHHAMDAVALAGLGFLLAGRLFPYPAHQDYFHRQIAPRLGGKARFIGPIGLRRKRRFLAAARCLVVPSLVAETSSLVAMEALACGTPVVAFPSGALTEIVEHGKTGFLVNTVGEMAEAIRQAGSLSAQCCRTAARTRFNLGRTVRKYFEIYRSLADSKSELGQKKELKWAWPPH